MVIFLITSFAVLAVIVIGLYLWQKPSYSNDRNLLPPLPNARGLFSEDTAGNTTENELVAVSRRREAEALIDRARNGELPALDEASLSGDGGLYGQVLTALVQRAGTQRELLPLMSHVASQGFPVNRDLAHAVIKSWHEAPDRSGTAKALHFAALSDEPGTYQTAVESALQLWREGKLSNISAAELRALFDGEFWVLSSRSRRSGAGFLLKRILASARRELEAATRANQ